MKKPTTETPAPDLAGLISAVLRHPDTPDTIRHGILEGMAYFQYDDTDESHIRLVLEGAKKAEAR